MGRVLPSSRFTGWGVCDAMHKRGVWPSAHGVPSPRNLPRIAGCRSLAGPSWRRDNAELLQQAEHVKIHPVVGHLAIHDTKYARAGDVNCFASRRHSLEGASIRRSKADAASDFVSLSKDIFDLQVKSGER